MCHKYDECLLHRHRYFFATRLAGIFRSPSMKVASKTSHDDEFVSVHVKKGMYREREREERSIERERERC
jgi:hypothetical protein